MDWELFYNSFRKPGFVPGFELQNRLGGGAFGDVYKARKVSIGKPYAIKFLKIDDQAQRAAIERELEQVRHFAAIDHPNLVTIEDMGVALDVPYLVMGYAGEDTLARRLRRERIPTDTSIAIFEQICRGVSTLHQRRLAHFDLKPSNVFLKGQAARVGDYGLAKLMIDGRQTLTFGRGTPHYMAPEMLKNRADQRADIYSLGVILYEMLSGKLPFEPPEGAGDGLGLVLREDDRPPPFTPDFPAPWRGVVVRCLRLDPTERFQTVDELLVAIERGQRGLEPLTAPPTRSAPARVSVELRATAAEVARGAVEVARGVWAGLREGSAKTPTSAPGGAQPALSATPPPLPTQALATPPPVHTGPAHTEPVHTGQELVAIETLSAAARRMPLFGVPGTAAAAAAGRPLPARIEPPPSEPMALAPIAALTPAAAGALRGAGTIPVPPRGEGGIVRAVWASVQLGLEVFLALLYGPVRSALGSVGRAGDRFVRGGRSLLGALLRMVVFLCGMMLLGALLMFLLLTWFVW